MEDLESLRPAIAALCAKYGVVERPVDLVPKDGLHWVIRERVLGDAEVLFAA